MPPTRFRLNLFTTRGVKAKNDFKCPSIPVDLSLRCKSLLSAFSPMSPSLPHPNLLQIHALFSLQNPLSSMDAHPPFSDSNEIVSGGTSSICYVPPAESSPSTEPSEPEIVALRLLSDNLDSIFNSNSYSDAKIAAADGREVAVHRCILSARSPFFKNVFSDKERGVKLKLKDLAKDFDVSFDALFTVLGYLYRGRLRLVRPEGVCVCVDEECDHVACRPAVNFLAEVLYASFVFEIAELVALYQKHLLDILDKIAADDILVVLCLANICGDDLRMRLLYLENRVGLAKLLFPMEAKVAMDIAQVDGTSEFTLASINSKNVAGAQRIIMDLNDAPFKIKDEHLNRIRALSKTVELGKRFFPRCSAVLNKMMDDDDWSELAAMQNETQEDRQLKKRRYSELQEVITKAFQEDKEEFSKSINISSSSSSTSIGGFGMPNGSLTMKK
ncbi:hypothetical protein Vadar_007258 [Vaccinium darrowii]|uniref:Uncharacterized protein n=1 Tax=Vaccinium darrowii TaxID=229202 RepID=A0ACB7YD77_9ERIC|nr:hypothetical protein Vadar_007258 [Vaccinium darrowii]